MPDSATVVVDGSFSNSMTKGLALAGAGLVLIDADTMEMVASRQCRFLCRTPSESEVQAVRRGALWVPGIPVVTDCKTVVYQLQAEGIDVHWLPESERRAWHHDEAHALSVRGRTGRVDRRGRLDRRRTR